MKIKFVLDSMSGYRSQFEQLPEFTVDSVPRTGEHYEFKTDLEFEVSDVTYYIRRSEFEISAIIHLIVPRFYNHRDPEAIKKYALPTPPPR